MIISPRRRRGYPHGKTPAASLNERDFALLIPINVLTHTEYFYSFAITKFPLP